MTDYLLRFPSKGIAEEFLLTKNPHDHALFKIGKHNNADYWVLFRDFVGVSILESEEQFVYWVSSSGTEFPKNSSTPNIFWYD